MSEKMELAQKKCIPCQGGIPPMEEEKAKEMLKYLKEWKLIDKEHKIQKEFKFKNFKEALGFVINVAHLAESENHHPDISISYNVVVLTLFTHKIKGLHKNDFILAAKIDGIQ